MVRPGCGDSATNTASARRPVPRRALLSLLPVRGLSSPPILPSTRSPDVHSAARIRRCSPWFNLSHLPVFSSVEARMSICGSRQFYWPAPCVNSLRTLICSFDSEDIQNTQRCPRSPVGDWTTAYHHRVSGLRMYSGGGMQSSSGLHPTTTIRNPTPARCACSTSLPMGQAPPRSALQFARECQSRNSGVGRKSDSWKEH